MRKLPSSQEEEPAGRQAAQTLSRLRLNQGDTTASASNPLLFPALALLSGIALSLAHAPADLGWIAYVALVPFAVVYRMATPPTFFLAALVFGMSYTGAHMWWIRIFGNLAWAALSIEQGVFIAVGLSLVRILLRPLQRKATPLAFPTAFLVVEYLRAELPVFGITWGGLGYTQHNSSGTLRLASYGGVWAISFLIAWINSLVAELLFPSTRRARLLIVPVAAAITVGIPFVLPVEEPDGPSARIAMIQGNAPEDLLDPHADDVDVLQNHVRLTRSLSGSYDLVVWPESSIDADPFAYPELGQPLLQVIQETGSPFVVGASIDRPGMKFLNTSLFFSEHGEPLGRYAKIHLVPFGEFVPMRRLLTPWVQELSRVPRDGEPGEEPVVFAIPKGRFASVICFESTFPSLVRSFIDRGAGFVIVSTNNSSFERTAASRQHLAFSQLRAAEHRIWVAHTALTGISAVIGPDGEVKQQTGLFEPAVLTPDIRFARRATPYGRVGDWIPWLAVAVTLVSAAFGWIARHDIRG